MITGHVISSEARIRLKVKGLKGREKEVDAIIDTGFTASLTLPPSTIKDLGLRWVSVDLAILADGSTCDFDVYNGKVVWDGKVRNILVNEADADSLVGMRLLRGHELKMHVRSHGRVTIRRKQGLG